MENSKEQAEADVTRAHALELLKALAAEVEGFDRRRPDEAVVSLHRFELLVPRFEAAAVALIDYQFQRRFEQINFVYKVDTWHRRDFARKHNAEFHYIGVLRSCAKLVEKYIHDPERYAATQKKIEMYASLWDGIQDRPDERDIAPLMRTAMNVLDEMFDTVSLIESRATRLELLNELAKFFTP